MAEAIRNISGTIWDREIPGIVRMLRADGVSEFTISDDPSGLLDTLSVFEAHGAKLQGRPDTGALKVGNAADIIAIDLDKPHLFPNNDTVGLVCYSAQGSDVCMTMVDGKILYENGQYLTLDKEKIVQDFKTAVKDFYG